jgi:hypothetical protein
MWILALVIALLAFIVACRTPKADAAEAETSTQRLLQTASQANGADATASASAQLRERLGAEEHVQQTFSSENGTKRVTIDADVIIPEASKLSVVEVHRADLTQDLADRVVNALVKGQLAAYDQQAARLYGSSRVQKHIDALDALIAKAGSAKSAEWRAAMHAERDYWADVLENSTETSAPISGVLTHPSWTNADAASGYDVLDDDMLQVVGMAESEVGCETLSMRKGRDESVIFCYVREPNECVDPGAQIGSYKSEAELLLEERKDGENLSGDIRLADVAGIPQIQTTQEQAITVGDQLIRELGVSDISCVAAEQCWGGSFDPDASGVRGLPTAAYGVTNPFRCVWRLRYTRTFNGLPTTYDTIPCQPYLDPEDDNEELPFVDYENIQVYVDDTGIVGFRWAAPLTTGDVLIKDAAVLPFREIMKVFSGAFLVANDWSNSPASEMDFRITQIRFGYVRIRDADVYDTGILIPAWDFYGECVYDPNGDLPEYGFRYDQSMFTINAIDGSIIDRQLGY